MLRRQTTVGFRLSIGLLLMGMSLTSWTACSWFKRADGLAGIAPIALSPVLRVPASLAMTTITYQNACGAPATVPIGSPLVVALQQKMGRVFQRVVMDQAVSSDGAIDASVGLKQIDLAIPRRINKSYPVTVTIGLDVAYMAGDGSTLWMKKLQSSGLGEVEVQETSCDVTGLESVVKEAIDLVAEGAAKQISDSIKIREYAGAKPSRGPALAPAVATLPVAVSDVAAVSARPVESAAQASRERLSVVQSAAAIPSNQAGDASAILTFRVILRDDNRDHILQPDEPLTIDVEVKNEGRTEAQGVEVLVEGTGVLTAQLPPTMAVGDVLPGEIKRVTVTKPMTSAKEPLRGELLFGLRSVSPLAQIPPVKKFTVLVKPSPADSQPAAIDVDQPPKGTAALRQQKAVVIAIGVGRYRDTQVPSMKFAARDAEVMASYLQSIGGLSADRVRLLTDGHGLKQDLAETFDEWLPKRVDPNTVVYVYVAGRALVDGVTGAVSLVPYDGTTASMGRLYSIRRMQEALVRLPIQRAILMFDVSLEHAAGADPATGAAPAWEVGATDASAKMMWMIGNNGLQESQAFEPGRHGLFTYQLLRGLQGPADLDRDGTVVAGELCAFARGEVARMTSEQIGSSQQPVCLPAPGQGALVRIHPMAKGNNPKPIVPAKKETAEPGESPASSPAGVGPGQ
ncbi:MAG: hypothetical protein BVN29_00045 [Nitrospira sp. ST-bin5]|nr:MAG: hypothetical protein BVN29_00045 [Nitrospira sp. ST-bin5]